MISRDQATAPDHGTVTGETPQERRERIGGGAGKSGPTSTLVDILGCRTSGWVTRAETAAQDRSDSAPTADLLAVA